MCFAMSTLADYLLIDVMDFLTNITTIFNIAWRLGLSMVNTSWMDFKKRAGHVSQQTQPIFQRLEGLRALV